MYFKRLEIHGFKSFADPAVIDFKDGITCIVGPNGSGKSNISDAIRWVLGEQSPKQLRGGRMEEVIFNGTETRRPKGMAEVTLTIDNSERILDVDYSEVAVTRRMYRSGDSEYLINNNICRLKDVRELFMDTGIGVDGYSIIGQGKIADIISDKPDSRRQIFEEAAGITSYKTKKAEAERKLADTRENLERIDDILHELESRDQNLADESQKAKKYLDLKERYRDLSVNIILKNIDAASDRADKYKIDIADLKAKAEFTSKNSEKAKTDQADLRHRRTVLDEKEADLRGQMPDLIQKVSEARKEQEFHEERVENVRKDIARVEKEKKAIRDQIDHADAEYDETKEKYLAAVSESHDADNVLDEKKGALARIEQELGRKDRVTENGSDRLMELHSAAASKKGEAESIENYKSTLTRRRRDLEGDMEVLLHDKSKANVSLREAENRRNAQQKSKDQIEQELIQTSRAMQDLQIRMDASAKEAQARRITIERLQERKKTIEEMEHNYEGYSHAVRYIMHSGLSGVEGVAADLLDVPAGMETAIETALGGGKQNVIMRDDRSAQKAVNALKLNRAGRLTFLPVESIEARPVTPDRQLREDPGFLGMAVDLVHFNERYRNIFRYLLGRAVVVDTLDAAIRLSKRSEQRFRYVTLDGEIVNASGAITGGTFRQRSANLLSRKNELSQLVNDTEKEKGELIRTERDLEDVKNKYSDLKRKRDHLAEELKKTESALAAVKPQIEQLSNQMNAADENVRKADAEIAQVKKELEEADRMISSLMDESKSAEDEISKISAEIEEAAEETERRREALDGAKAEVTEATIRANEVKNRVKSLDELQQRARISADDLRKQLAERDTYTHEREVEIGRMNSGTADTAAALERYQQEQKSLTSKIEQVIASRKELDKKIASIDEQMAEYEREIRLYTGQQSKLEIEAARNETTLDNLRDKLWDEFEMSYAQALDLKWDVFVMSSSVKEARDIRNQMKALGNVHIGAIQEYEQVHERYTFLTDQQQDVRRAGEELQAIIDDMDQKIVRKFRENFDEVRRHFQRIFRELFGGGTAELEMDDAGHPLESGIEIISQPPGKRLQNINLLSGGEKTMTALALMFAVITVTPTPFCILDEVEAALDDENIARFADYLKNFRSTQFALITHQKATMEHADVLYGITMAEEGVSKVISLKLDDPKAQNFVE